VLIGEIYHAVSRTGEKGKLMQQSLWLFPAQPARDLITLFNVCDDGVYRADDGDGASGQRPGLHKPTTAAGWQATSSCGENSTKAEILRR
jgi:hypothetical protein